MSAAASEGLSQALRSLCNRTGWCYAVFWKLKRRSRMVLTWEDSYYEFAPISAAAAAGAGPVFNRGCTKQDGGGGGIAEDQIQLAVAKMSFQVYSLGEGTIGRVAFSGKHQWVFGTGERCLDNYGASAALENGWANQFAAGIKTIAVIAVQQQGVVQLGSTQMMSEDLNLISQIRALFGSLQGVPGAFVPDFAPDGQAARCLSVPKAIPTYTAAKPAPTLAAYGSCGRTAMSSRAACASVAVEGGGAEHVMNAGSLPKTVDPNAGFQHSWPIPCMEQKPHEMRTSTPSGLYSSRNSFARDGHDFDQGDPGGLVARSMTKAAAAAPARSVEQPTLYHGGDAGRLAGFSNELSYGQRDDVRQLDASGWPPPSDPGLTVRDYDPLPTSYVEETSGMMRPGPEDGFDYNTLFRAFQKDDLDDFNNLLASLNKEYPVEKQATSSTSCSQFAFGDELSEVVVCNPGKCAPSKEELYVSMAADDSSKNGKLVLPFDVPATSMMDKARDAFVSLSGDRPEQLLDAVVAGAASSSSLASKLPSALPVKASAAPSVPPLTVGNAVQYLEKQLSTSSSLDRGDMAANWPASSASVDVSSSSWTEGSQAKRLEEHSYSKDTASGGAPPSVRKQEEATRMAGRKRLRPGEAPRPRPKDRQQIQDRVRELRDIVPNATKCSIDALLEKTIRHMKFLQSVTQHGDKWKAGAEAKGERDVADSSSGSSFALEVDGKGSGVPILVENLKQPRQMLVEMLCEERGLFWEIAENIRGLGLTILKGVMESRNDKIWARFNVEVHAAKDVNRLKVVWNLTQLLKPSGKNGIIHHHTTNGNNNSSSSSFVGSEMSDVCSESFGTRFQHPVASHGITVSPGGVAGGAGGGGGGGGW